MIDLPKNTISCQESSWSSCNKSIIPGLFATVFSIMLFCPAVFIGGALVEASLGLVKDASAQSFNYPNVRRSTDVGRSTRSGGRNSLRLNRRSGRVNQNRFEEARIDQIRAESKYAAKLAKWQKRQIKIQEKKQAKEAKRRAKVEARERSLAARQAKLQRKRAEKERKRQAKLESKRSKEVSRLQARELPEEELEEKKPKKKVTKTTKKSTASSATGKAKAKKPKKSLFERFRESLFN